jgi:hypothetical protein
VPWPDPADDWDDDDPAPTAPYDLEIDITEPVILGELYGPNA